MCGAGYAGGRGEARTRQERMRRLGLLLCQKVEGELVGLAVEVFEQGGFEEGVVGGSGQKQGHAGAEFEIVGIAEYLLSAAPFHIKHHLRALAESGTQDRVLKIGLGLIKRANGKLLRCAATTKTGDLRKDKPDPVTGFSPGAEFSKNCFVDGCLGGEEAVEVVGLGHGLGSR